jgi:hypothetical protein
MSLLNENLDYQLRQIENKIRIYNEFLENSKDVNSKLMGLPAKYRIRDQYYDTMFHNLHKHAADLDNDKRKYIPLLVSLEKKVNDLMQSVASSTDQQLILFFNQKIERINLVIKQLKKLLELQKEIEYFMKSSKSNLNIHRTYHSSQSLQGLAAAAIPKERIKKLSPKSRKIVKRIIKNTENVYIPNEELWSSPETSPETAAEYVNRTKYAIRKRSARSKKRQYKK